MSEILKGLNEKQVEAVTHFEGPLLVIAGAGSGKTKALTHRVAYLIKERNVSPWNVLAVTFTNKAANEMKRRIVELLKDKDELNFMESFGDIFSAGDFEKFESSNIPTIGTFHSICVRILRKTIHTLDYENSFAIFDTADQQILVKKVMNDLFVDPKRINPKAVLTHISNAKNQLIGPSEYHQYANDYFSQKVADIYPAYQKALMKNNALDFDDIIMKTVEIFEKNPQILNQYQEKFRFISIDEYQDTNKAQFVLINQLASKYKNLAVIGDGDQSIYGWRGATVQNIMDFEKIYPESKVVFLEQNYRSSQIILDASNKIIQKNSLRKDKKLWTDKKGGENIQIKVAENERHESELIAQEIINLSADSEAPDFNDYVVLYRTNAQSRVLEEVFLRYGLPYKIVGGIRFYERKEVKDMVAYLRLSQNVNDSVSLLRIVNTPSRKIGARTLEVLQAFALKHNLSFFNAMLLADEISDLSGAKAQEIEKFVKLIKEFQSLNSQFPASGMIKQILELSGYKQMLDDGSIEGEARLENIRELISVAQKYDKLAPGISTNIFLEEISLIADIDNVDTKENAVTFMTVHSAKGLEYPTVFIAGLEEGIFPHSRSLLDQHELEEERRLMYVAMTRAMERLYFLYTRSRTLYGESRCNSPSQFLDDIPEEFIELDEGYGYAKKRIHSSISEIGEKPVPIENDSGFELELSIGDKVSHGIFGNGVVIDVQGGVATVAFEDPSAGVKKLAISIAPLRKI